MNETSQSGQQGAGGGSQPALDALYRLLVENSVDVVVYSVGGVLQWISPSVTDLLGWTPAELIGTTTAHLWHPDDRAAAVALRDAVYAGRTGRGVFRLRAKDGHHVWIETSLRPYASDGQSGAVGTMRDVGDRVRAEQALAASRAQLRATLDGLLDPQILLAAVRNDDAAIVDFVYLDVNSATCEYLSRSREELIGMRLTQVLANIKAAGLLDPMIRTVESGAPMVIDDVPYTSHILGQTRRYDMRASKVGDGLSLTWRDVTERHEAAEVIRRRVAELAALQRLSELLVRRVDLASAVDAVAALLTTLFAARTVQILPQREAAADAPSAATLAADGTQRLAVPLVAHGERYGLLAIVRDATARPFDAEEATLAATAADLLAAVIHGEQLHQFETEEAAEEARRRIARDLHDAVTQSIYSANLIAESLPAVYAQAPEKALEQLLLVRRLIRAALAELRILLYELRPETLIMAPLETLFERLRDALAGHTELTVTLHVDAQLILPPEVRTVVYHVAQEALNNVGKHAHAQHVTVALAGDGQGVRLTVHDDGQGFDPALTPPGMGSGIMRERAAGIGAELSVASAPGAGTTVTLTWRPNDAAAAAAAPQA